MTIEKRKGLDTSWVFKLISEKRSVNPDGSISTNGFGALSECESFLRTAIIAKGKSEAFLRRVVGEAMDAQQELNEDKFIKLCNKIATLKIKNDQKPFKVMFPIWGGGELFASKRKWNDVWITFYANPDSNFVRRATNDRAALLRDRPIKGLNASSDFGHLPLAVCSVQAIDAYDAFEQAHSAICKEIGLYSLICERGQNVLSNDDRPINTVLLAPPMTVHNPTTGAISADVFWYDQWPVHMNERIRSQSNVLSIQKEAAKVRKRLQGHPWRDRAEEALLRYCLAFGQFDLEASFLDGWRLLEFIGGEQRENSETIVKRAAWFFDRPDMQKQFGLHLMHRRHLISHGRPIRDGNNESLAFQMKSFLKPFLHAFLINPFNFEHPKDLWDFCDLPVDSAARVRKSKLLNCGARFRREK